MKGKLWIVGPNKVKDWNMVAVLVKLGESSLLGVPFLGELIMSPEEKVLRRVAEEYAHAVVTYGWDSDQANAVRKANASDVEFIAYADAYDNLWHVDIENECMAMFA